MGDVYWYRPQGVRARTFENTKTSAEELVKWINELDEYANAKVLIRQPNLFREQSTEKHFDVWFVGDGRDHVIAAGDWAVYDKSEFEPWDDATFRDRFVKAKEKETTDANS